MDQHSLHSPFIYELYTKVIRPKKWASPYAQIEKVREKFKSNDQTISIEDFGSGSYVDNSSERKISDIALKGISKKKYSEIFARLIDYEGFKNIIELGTSLGINTLYLSSNADSHVTTFEGAEELCKMAISSFKSTRSNVDVVEGNIDDTLPEFLKNSKKIDLAFFDANHNYESTLSYFHQCRKKAHDESCFIFDDIHLSQDMERAWREIQQYYEVTVSIDLFQVGLVFFNPELTKQHYILEI